MLVLTFPTLKLAGIQAASNVKGGSVQPLPDAVTSKLRGVTVMPRRRRAGLGSGEGGRGRERVRVKILRVKGKVPSGCLSAEPVT